MRPSTPSTCCVEIIDRVDELGDRRRSDRAPSWRPRTAPGSRPSKTDIGVAAQLEGAGRIVPADGHCSGVGARQRRHPAPAADDRRDRPGTPGGFAQLMFQMARLTPAWPQSRELVDLAAAGVGDGDGSHRRRLARAR